MATSSTRQRKLARSKVDRQLARRAERERRQRQVRAAAAGLLTLAVLIGGGLWLAGVFDKKPAPVAAPDDCSWTEQDVAANNNLKAVGTPAKTGIAKTGTSSMTIAMKAGEATGTVAVELDRGKAKCATAALTYLAARNFYGETKCHELTHAEGSFALRCGDPSDTGNGGAAFTWFPENQPSEPLAPTADPSASPGATPSPAPAQVLYPRGTIAMMPGVTGSQFLIFYKDSTISTVKYSIVGRVTSGLEFIDKIAEAGTVADSGTKPKNDVIIQTLTVVDNATMPSATPSPQPSTSATPAS